MNRFRKDFCGFFIILVICVLFSLPADATDFSSSFENSDDSMLWAGGTVDESAAFEDEFGIYINNPFGEVKNSQITHVLEYNEKISLEAGCVYTVSGYVINPVSDYSPSVRTRAFLEQGARTVIVNINGIGNDWAPFTTTFYASETGEYNLALHFNNGDVDFGFFADSISMEKTDCILSSLSILGENKLLIPATGSINTRFSPILTTSDGKTVHLLMSGSVFSEATMAEGIEYDPSSMTLTVYPEAADQTVITISCALLNTSVVSPTSFDVVITNNLFSDNAISDNLWVSDSEYEILSGDEGDYISLPASDYSSYGYFSTLSYEQPVVLIEGATYVLRAKIKSDSPERTYSIYAKNTTENNDGSLHFNIVDIAGEEWTQVVAAFTPEASGVYDIAINLYSPYDCTFFVENISLRAEFSKPEYITIHAPGNIALPDIATKYPISAIVRDQLGNEIFSEACDISIENENDSFFYSADEGAIYVSPDASVGEYIVTASSLNNPELQTSFAITISHDYIGDGQFENKVVNEWWMTSSPYATSFSIRDSGQKYAHVDCDGDYFILFNNSYVHLIENTAYAFNSSIQSSVDCMVTVFIETIDNKTLPLVQFPLSAQEALGEMLLPELFISEEDSIGRLLLYFQSEGGEPFTVTADNLSLKKAVIKAAYPSISGNLSVNGSGKAEYSLYNNISYTDDSSSGIFSWYVSDKVDGEYTLLPESSRYLYFDTTFKNKYVYFEFTPVCPVTGFSGEKIASAPVFIEASDGGYMEEEPTFEEEPLPPKNEDSLVLSPIAIVSSESSAFSDIEGHWAKGIISSLHASGIINGKSENEFSPDTFITRAEAVSLFSRAFGIKENKSPSVFTDISETDWFFGHVNSLNKLGIISGTSDKVFSPYKNITRQELAAIIMRLYNKTESEKPSLSEFCFNDSNMISPWAENLVTQVVSLKIMQGNPSNCFMPQANATRAEAAAVLFRLFEVIKNEKNS